MPFILIFIGLLLTIAGVRGQEKELLSLIKSDMTGDGSFKGSYIAWILAIGAIGSLGYIKQIRPIANAFLVLIIVVLFLSNKGFFTQFYKQVQTLASNSGSAGDAAGVGNPLGLGWGSQNITKTPTIFDSIKSIIPSLTQSSSPSSPTSPTLQTGTSQ